MIGQTLHNRYTIKDRLGKGAMGTVYRAADSQTGQEVAVKVIARELAFNADMLERFKREGQALHQLRHPNIVGFVDAFQLDDQYIIVMEYVPGGSLHDLIKQGRLPVERAQRIALELCDAITRAHHLNIIHRDLKPENILITPDGAPKLTDFGVAKLVEGSRLTGTGTQVGTPYYMSPEAWEGKPLDAQADIWSLGIIFYEMLSGEVPFGGDTLIAVMNKVLTAPLPDIKKKRPDVPDGLARIVRRMLARKKTDRYHTMRELAFDIERGTPVSSGSRLPTPPAAPGWARIALAVTVLGFAAVALVCGGIWAVGALRGIGTTAPGGQSTQPPATQLAESTSAPTNAPPVATNTKSPTETPKPATALPAVSGEPVTIHWFIGLGTGSDPSQLNGQQAVVNKFNKTHPQINLVLEVVPNVNNQARDALATRLAAGDAPDIVGPTGIAGAEQPFHGQWLDLSALIDKTGYDLTQYPLRAVQHYNIDGQGQISMPFLLYPSALYYQRSMFDEAGLNYPPHNYGDPYIWSDGSSEQWTFDTLRKVAMKLTLDSSGHDATDPLFNSSRIVQYGYEPQWQSLAEIGSFFGASSLLDNDGKTAQVPPQWAEAWQWLYDGVWKDHFIASQSVIESADFGSTNVFNSGKVAMALSHSWYTCCISEAGNNWDLAVVPSHLGQVTATLHADSFFIYKGTQHPDEAFEVLRYFVNEGSSDLRAVYGSLTVPALKTEQESYITAMNQQFPQGADWQILLDGIDYADTPSHEGYLPNASDAYSSAAQFLIKMRSTPGLNFNTEVAGFERDMQDIFGK